MFRELAPFLRHRAVLLTVTHLEHDQIRVNVVPKKLKDGENEALTTPLSVTGTAEELDAELPKTLTDFVGAHLQLSNSLESAKAQMEAAAKAAQAEARNKTKTPAKKDALAQKGEKTSEPTRPVEPPKPAAPKSPSLFDLSPSPARSPLPPAEEKPAMSSEDEILAEVDEDDDAASDELDEAA